ncbi:MAG TPA: competence/damage-inducible protein A [Actinomycetota bacterium]|nr:competence/damage-inducible protein A [Actinomycetota bacterium]
MRAEVLAVGTELLLGDIVNTNAAHIGRVLAEAGIDCYMHATVGDNEERIADAIVRALERADAVIITGGLGPTQDDVTREAIARVTGKALRRDPDLSEQMRARFASLKREMPENNLRQADVPEGARIIEQTWGTAPGLIVEHAHGVIYAIPGVPAEMQDMLERGVLPDMLSRRGEHARIVSRVVRIAGLSESGIAESLQEHWDMLGGSVTMAFLAGGGEVRIRLTAKAPDEQEALVRIDAAESGIRSVLGSAVVGIDGESLEIVCGNLLLARGRTLACAESLTGGALGARIASVPGASEWFRGSIVSYATDVKASVLGVPEDVLSANGPVSVPVARAMASGARRVLGADVAIALTGVAGPIEQGRPVGTVVIAVDGPEGDVVREVRLPGDRNTVRTLAAGAGLNLARLYLLGVAR